MLLTSDALSKTRPCGDDRAGPQKSRCSKCPPDGRGGQQGPRVCLPSRGRASLGSFSQPATLRILKRTSVPGPPRKKCCTRCSLSGQYYRGDRFSSQGGLMMTAQTNRVLTYLRRAVFLNERGLTDAELLERFLARREELAFEALLRRHAPMVL